MKKLVKTKLRKGDTVQILVGKSQGQSGKIDRIDLKNSRVWVENQNVYKRHTKPNPNSNVDGGILDKVMPVHISNVAIIDEKSKKPSRLGFKVEGEQKSRFFKKSGSLVG